MIIVEQYREFILDNIAASTKARQEAEFPFRHHLGASLLGHSCQRFLFYTFRWVQLPSHSSRTQRIFERGHTEEDRMLDLLEQAGMTIYRIDPKTGKQYRAPNLPTHVGGSIDAILAVPAALHDAMGDYIPIECKTHNQRSASKTFKGNLREHYPQHFSQGNIYGTSINAKYFMYVGLNKNTDELYIEFVPIFEPIARLQVKRGVEVVSTQAFRTLDVTEEKWRCKMCDFKDVCKKGLKAPSVNCRSCQNFLPMDDGTWYCTLHNKFVEKYAEIETATQCDDWASII